MPKLNAVLMVVLAVAVIAVTGLLVLRTSSTEPNDERESVKVEKLIRKLADPDSDQRREGEDGLRRMGPAAVAPLKEASTSADRVLAGRAAKLLLEFQPPAPADRASAAAE